MLTVAIPKRNKLQNIIVLTPKDGTEIESGGTVFPSPLPFPGKAVSNRRKTLILKEKEVDTSGVV